MWLKHAALIGEAVLLIQLPLFAWQVYRQDKDTTIVRRAQLLATIYDCVEPEPDKESEYGFEICPPKAHPRARVEAVKALAEIDGTDLDLSSADLSGLGLEDVNLSGADLGFADLAFTRLDRAILNGANLYRATLESTSFRRAELREANLMNAAVRSTSFTEADLSGADLRSRVIHVRFGEVQAMQSPSSLHQAQIHSANGNAETRLPDWLTHPEHWLDGESTSDPAPDED